MSHGLSKFEVKEGVAGDIVQLTGIADAHIGDTIADALTQLRCRLLRLRRQPLKFT